MAKFIYLDELRKDLAEKDRLRRKAFEEIKGVYNKIKEFNDKYPVAPNVLFVSISKYNSIEDSLQQTISTNQFCENILLYGTLLLREIPELPEETMLLGYRKIYTPTVGDICTIAEISQAENDFAKKSIFPNCIIMSKDTLNAISPFLYLCYSRDIQIKGKKVIVSKVAKNNVMVCLLEEI